MISPDDGRGVAEWMQSRVKAARRDNLVVSPAMQIV